MLLLSKLLLLPPLQMRKLVAVMAWELSLLVLVAETEEEEEKAEEVAVEEGE